MSEYNAKNYTEQGGDVTHIGGKLIIEDGAIVEGLPGGDSYELPVASASELGGVKVGDGLDINENGELSVDSNDIDLPAATNSRLGVVKPGSYLEVTGIGEIKFKGLSVHAIKVSGTTADNNVSVTIPSGIQRNLLWRHFFDRKVTECYVVYEDGNGNALFYADIQGIDKGINGYAYFHGYKGLGGESPEEYIIAIDTTTTAEPNDLVFVRSLSLA